MEVAHPNDDASYYYQRNKRIRQRIKGRRVGCYNVDGEKDAMTNNLLIFEIFFVSAVVFPVFLRFL